MSEPSERQRVFVVSTLPPKQQQRTATQTEDDTPRQLEVASIEEARTHSWANEAASGGWSADIGDDSRGVGDSVAKLTHALGIEQCNGCRQRQMLLNALLPYSDL